MQAIIDKSVPSALTYYSTYLAEPSPAGDIALAPDRITAVEHMNLKILLSGMKEIGSEGEILVVTHASPKGFLMKIWPGADSSLQFSGMTKILETAEGVRRREAIRLLSPKEVPEAWRKWFGAFDKGIKLTSDYATNPDWQKYVEKMFGQWFEDQGRSVHKLSHGGKDLKELLDLLNDVRKLRFKRIEFRACQLGADKDKDAMKTIAQFLQVQTVVAPKTWETFYGSIPLSQIRIISDATQLDAALKRLGGRKFGSSLGILMLPHGVRIVAQDQDTLKAFVKKFISAKFDGSISSLVVGGLNSVGAGAVIFDLPLEADYKRQLVQFDAGAASSSGVP
jgi:hypothetical protein